MVSDSSLLSMSWDSYRKKEVSYSCKCVVSALGVLRDGLQWRIGDGNSAHFWTDCWLDKPLIEMTSQLPGSIDLTAKVSDFILDHGIWDSSKVYSLLPRELAAHVLGYPFTWVC